MNDESYMRLALEEAAAAEAEGEMPVGCVIVLEDKVIAHAHNACESAHDPTAHAEILAIQKACKACGDWRLNRATLYVTLEPCPMCAGAIMQARVGRLVYGASDPEQGCAGSVYRIPEDPAFGTFTFCDGGILQTECISRLRAFFEWRRKE